MIKRLGAHRAPLRGNGGCSVSLLALVDAYDKLEKFMIDSIALMNEVAAQKESHGDKGNLSYVGDSVAENDVTLSELRYTPFEPETTSATLSGSSTVTLGDGAVIEVGEGQTLVVSAPVVFAGTVRKIGFGKVVFKGPVTDETLLTVERGCAKFSGKGAGCMILLQ